MESATWYICNKLVKIIGNYCNLFPWFHWCMVKVVHLVENPKIIFFIFVFQRSWLHQKTSEGTTCGASNWNSSFFRGGGLLFHHQAGQCSGKLQAAWVLPGLSSWHHGCPDIFPSSVQFVTEAQYTPACLGCLWEAF